MLTIILYETSVKNLVTDNVPGGGVTGIGTATKQRQTVVFTKAQRKKCNGKEQVKYKHKKIIGC